MLYAVDVYAAYEISESPQKIEEWSIDPSLRCDVIRLGHHGRQEQKGCNCKGQSSLVAHIV